MAVKHSRANYDHLGVLWNDAKVRFWRAQVLQSTRPSPNLPRPVNVVTHVSAALLCSESVSILSSKEAAVMILIPYPFIE